MTDHDHNKMVPAEGFWQSRTGIVLLVFLAVGALLLGYEHRVHIFAGNAFSAALLLGCVVMHFFMHGGRGGHGGHRANSSKDSVDKP